MNENTYTFDYIKTKKLKSQCERCQNIIPAIEAIDFKVRTRHLNNTLSSEGEIDIVLCKTCTNNIINTIKKEARI